MGLPSDTMPQCCRSSKCSALHVLGMRRLLTCPLSSCSRVFASLLAGLVAGVWGITGWSGFAYYFVAHLLVSPVQPVEAELFPSSSVSLRTAAHHPTLLQGQLSPSALLPEQQGAVDGQCH